MKALATVLGLLVLTGCAAPPFTPTCSASSAPMRVFDLYFGLSLERGQDVTDAEWDKFRTTVITRDLPGGYTVLDGTGAWLKPKTQTTNSERTKIMVVAMPDTAAAAAAIERVRSAYEKQFKQTSVGMITHLACGSFD